jgi:type IV pilus assembly protein PilP
MKLLERLFFIVLLLTAASGFCQERPIIDDSGARQPLELYELSSLRYVKFRESSFGKIADVLAPDGRIYSVKQGEFMGRNIGRIERITNDSIYLLEIVPDGVGWKENKTRIPIEP